MKRAIDIALAVWRAPRARRAIISAAVALGVAVGLSVDAEIVASIFGGLFAVLEAVNVVNYPRPSPEEPDELGAPT